MAAELICRGCGFELATSDGACLNCPAPCPGCGCRTDDAAGGPCSRCWAEIDALPPDGNEDDDV